MHNYTYLPENFNILQHINLHNPQKFNLIRFDIDKAKYILSLIKLLPIGNKDVQDRLKNNGGYTPLYSNALQSVVHDYKRYINYFIETDVIETNSIYIPKKSSPNKATSFGYKYTVQYDRSKCVISSYSSQFTDKLKKHDKKRLIRYNENYKHLVKWLYPKCKLTIDKEKAYKYLNINYLQKEHSISVLENSFNSNELIQEDCDIYNQYTSALMSINKIINNDIYCIFDETAARMHTNLTNIKSELRNFITYDNEKLTSIDIVCSQPYLTLFLFNLNNYNKTILNSIINNTILNNKLRTSITSTVLPMSEKLIKQSDNDDFRLFSSLVSHNEKNIDFYNYIKDEAYKLGVEYKDRKEAKTGIYEVMFSGNNYKSNSKSLFKKLFPTINTLYTTIKIEDKSRLACLLQSIEAHIVLQIITKKITQKYPKAPLFTIHDSIVTTEPYVNGVKQIMSDTLTKLTGFPPKLRIEDWSTALLQEKI